MKNLEQITLLTSEITTLETKLATSRNNYKDYMISYAEWDRQAQVKCGGIGKKKSDCEADKVYKAGKARENLAGADQEKINIATYTAAIAAKKLERTAINDAQTAANQAATTLAGKGLTTEAVEAQASAQAQAAMLKAATEAQNAVKESDNAEARKANRNKLFLAFGIFLFLVIVFLTIKYFKNKKSKPAN